MKSQITIDPLSFPFPAPGSTPGSIPGSIPGNAPGSIPGGIPASLPFAAVTRGSPAIPGGNDPLTEVLRRGALTLLTQAVEAEVTQWLAAHAHVVYDQGHQQVVRNG